MNRLITNRLARHLTVSCQLAATRRYPLTVEQRDELDEKYYEKFRFQAKQKAVSRNLRLYGTKERPEKDVNAHLSNPLWEEEKKYVEGNKERPFETGTLVWYRPVSHDKNRSKPKQGKGVIVPDDQYYEWENNLIHPSGSKGKLHVWVGSFKKASAGKLLLEETRVEFRRAKNNLNQFTRYKAIDVRALGGEPLEASKSFYKRSEFVYQAKGKIVDGRINYSQFYKPLGKAKGQRKFNGPIKLDHWINIDPTIKRAMNNPERTRTCRNKKPRSQSKYTSAMFDEGKWVKFSVYRSEDQATFGKLFARQFRPVNEKEPTAKETELWRANKYYLTEREVADILAQKNESSDQSMANTKVAEEVAASSTGNKLDA